MKVVFCAYDGKNIINGINAWFIRLLPQLAKNHVDVSVLFITWAPEDECTTIPLLRAQGITCSVIPMPYYTEKQALWIIKYLNDNNTDIFVPGNMVPALYASAYVKQSGIATVGIVHNDDDEYTAIIQHFLPVLSDIVAVSGQLYQKVKQLNKQIITYQIPYGAYIPENVRVKNTATPFRIVYIGRIVKQQKRIDDIAASFCKSAAKLTDCEFYIYGSGSDDYVVKEIIMAYQNPPNVFFAGNIANTEVQKVLMESHVIVLMSDYEGIPVALMEAMACGVVPICKKISSGIPELVKDGETGFFISTPDDLCEKISYLKQRPDEWARLSANCRQLTIESFSSVKNTNDWLNLLHDIIPKVKHKIKLPLRMKLPPVIPALAANDPRDPGLIKKALRKIKRTIKSIRSQNVF